MYVRLITILKTVDLNYENNRFGRFQRPAEFSSPKGIRIVRLWRDSHFDLLNSENKENLVAFYGIESSQCKMFVAKHQAHLMLFNMKPSLCQDECETHCFEGYRVLLEISFHLSESMVFRTWQVWKH